MNPIGIHASVWVGGWSEAEARLAIEESAAVGYDLIEIPVLDPASIDTAMTNRLLEAAGIAASCSLGLTFETDISSADPATVARGERLLGEALAVTRDLGGKYLCGVIASAMGRYTDQPSKAGRAHAVAAIRRLAEKAAPAGVTLGIEVVNRYESNLINTAAQALDFIADVAAPNVTVHLDSYHMNIEEDDLAAPIRACGDRRGYLHIGANNRGGLKQSMIDFPAMFAALRESGYQGPIAFESFSSAVVAPGLTSALCIWRELWTDGAKLAREARARITELQAAKK
jgi:D-psicose/D-tagatose/L-ribulose 3-epimerase